MQYGLAMAVVAALAASAATTARAGDPSLPSGQQADLTLRALVAEALERNPEILAARSAAQAAGQRVSPAGALDDPMLEVGLINVPTDSWRLDRDEMTMKMIGLAQRVPFPGKRPLRREVRQRDAEAAAHGYRETVNRVARGVKGAYLDLALALESIRIVKDNTIVLEQFLRIVESRYAVGQVAQSEVYKVQTQLSRMREELLRMERDRPVMEAELGNMLGRASAAPVAASLPGPPAALHFDLDALREAALRQRPQLLALQKLIDRNAAAIELARREYAPDLDVRLQYGQRDELADGMAPPDMVSLMFAINLPVWGAQKIDPMIAESHAMRDEAVSMYQAQQNELFAKLRQQVATAEQNLKSVALYDNAVLPQARLTVESSLAAYRVNRVDILMLLDSQMNLFSYGIGRAGALAGLYQALAEIELLVGAPRAGVQNGEGE